MNPTTLGYSTEDIMKVLQRAYDETGENRDRALKLYDHMENAMLNNKGDLVVLSQMADRYLEQATRQTELLVRLVGVMQKLKQFSGKSDGSGLTTDVNALLEILDNNKISPFTSMKKKTPVIAPTTTPSTPVLPPSYTGDPLPGQETYIGDPLPGQEPTNISKTGTDDVQFEAEL